jgi:hypothetical protein
MNFFPASVSHSHTTAAEVAHLHRARSARFVCPSAQRGGHYTFVQVETDQMGDESGSIRERETVLFVTLHRTEIRPTR